MTDDLISRKAVLDALRTWDQGKLYLPIEFMEFVDGLPSALETTMKLSSDAVEVVRCGECKFWTKQTDSIQGRCALFGMYPTSTWFCGNARRKEDDPNT